MFFIKKIYFRTYQFIFKLLMPFLPYREPELLHNMDDLAHLLSENSIKMVLIVAGNNVRKNNLTSDLEEALLKNNVSFVIYSDTLPNPTTNDVLNGKKIYLENNCDAIIAVGGGSQIDCAKAIGALIKYPKKNLKDLKGTLKVLRKLPLLIAIPTTAGSGSETTVTAVISDIQTHHKYTLNNFTMIPKYTLLDPKMTYTLPPSLTSTTGMDALTHAVEAYIGRSTTKRTRELSLEAIKLIFENILTAYNEPTNYEARSNMLKASYMAGCAFTKSYVGYIHAIAHPLGGVYNTPHGLANSVLMPIVLEEYGKCVYKKLYKIAKYINLVTESDSYETGAMKFIAKIKELNRKMNIPTHFDFILEADIKKMSKFAYSEANPLYPVPVIWDLGKIEKIYYLASNLKKSK